MKIRRSKNGITISPYRIPTILIAILFLLIPLDYILPHIGPATIVTLASITIILYGICYVLIHRRVMSFSNGSFSLVVLMAIFLVSIVWAINRDAVFSRFASVVNTFLLYLIITQFNYDKKTIVYIENASIIGAILLVVYILFNINLDLLYAGYRLKFSQLGSEYFSDPNGLAGRIMVPIAIAIDRVLNSKSKFAVFLGMFLTSTLLYVLLLTGSRAGVIAVILIAMIFLFQGLDKKKNGVLVSLMLLVVFFLIAPRILPEHITQRVFNLNKYREVATVEGDRIDIWKHVIIDLFYSSPIFGYGGGCSGYALAQFYGHIKAVHNSFLLVLCEVGFLGILPWLYFIIKQFREAFKLRKYSTVILPATIAVLFISMTLDAFTEKYLWSIFIYIHIVSCCFDKENAIENSRLPSL